MKYFSKEVRIGLVAIAGIVVLFFGLKYLKGLNLFSTGNKYYIEFTDISGLTVSSPVYADGYKVGVVKKIEYDYDHRGDINTEVEIDQNLRIPKGSSAEIVSDVLGNVKINMLFSNNPRERILPGERIQGGINSGTLGKVADMVPAIEKMLPKLDSILTSVNTLLADPALAASLHNVKTITSNLTVSTRELNALMAQLNRDVPGMVTRANGVLDNTNKLTRKLSDVDVEGTMNSVNATLNNVRELSERLNSNEGTLGLLMRDPSLYNNLNSTMRDADSLMINLKQHPKRYVHFSVFGKKDK
ncbi:MAG: MCE family protein [Prevotella sp.]|nr:MCE family protein [Prevotella sp.]